MEDEQRYTEDDLTQIKNLADKIAECCDMKRVDIIMEALTMNMSFQLVGLSKDNMAQCMATLFVKLNHYTDIPSDDDEEEVLH